MTVTMTQPKSNQYVWGARGRRKNRKYAILAAEESFNVFDKFINKFSELRNYKIKHGVHDEDDPEVAKLIERVGNFRRFLATNPYHAIAMTDRKKEKELIDLMIAYVDLEPASTSTMQLSVPTRPKLYP